MSAPIIGWIGTRVNLMYLETLRGVFSQVGQGPHPPRLKVVCDAFPTMPGIEVIPKVLDSGRGTRRREQLSDRD